MKTTVTLCFAFIVIITMAFIPVNFSMTGKWKMHNPKGGPTVFVNFKADSNFAGYTGENKLLVMGKYKVNNDTFFVKDNNCGGDYWGTYTLTFFGNDSLAIKLLGDSCSGRAHTIDGLTAKRVSK